MASKTYEELLKEAKSGLQDEKKKQLEKAAESYSIKSAAAENNAREANAAVQSEYADAYNKSSVAKLVNRKKLEERLANLGLSDSGYADAARQSVDKTMQRADAATDTVVRNKQAENNRKLQESTDSLQKEYMDTTDRISESFEKAAKETAESKLKAQNNEQEKLAKQQKEKLEKEQKERTEAEAKKLKEKKEDDYKTLSVRFRLINSRYDSDLTASMRDMLFGELKSLQKKYAGTSSALTNYDIANICQIIDASPSEYEYYLKNGTVVNSAENVLKYPWSESDPFGGDFW